MIMIDDIMVKLNSGDLVRIAFTGRRSSDQVIFETTDDKVARETGIFDPKAVYGPRLVIIDRGMMLPGLEAGVRQMEAGQTGKVNIPFSMAFGPRHKELVRIMPEREFAKQGVTPAPGLTLSMDGLPARVKSNSSGRVVLDFNHPLAEQDLTYVINLIEVISEPSAKIKALAEQQGINVTITSEKGKNVVSIPKGTRPELAEILGNMFRASVGDWAEVRIEK